jgi:RPA family protein
VSRRETAWRVTARELEAAIEEERGDGERAATYLLSPFGGRFHRVLTAGTLSVAESIGRDPAQPFWRARLTDPTGSVAVTAGGFQPRAMAQLRAVADPGPALVVGKVHLYRGRDGTGYVSVRAEAVRSVPEAAERAVLAEAIEQTLDRLDLVDRLAAGGNADGAPEPWVGAARESLRRYPQADRSAFRSALAAAVRHVGGTTRSPPPPPLPPTVRVVRDPVPPSRSPPSAAERAEEAGLLDLLEEIAEAALDSYADRRELLARAAAQGLGAARAEAILGRLEDEGVVEEPIVGKLRLSDRVE